MGEDERTAYYGRTDRRLDGRDRWTGETKAVYDVSRDMSGPARPADIDARMVFLFAPRAPNTAEDCSGKQKVHG